MGVGEAEVGWVKGSLVGLILTKKDGERLASISSFVIKRRVGGRRSKGNPTSQYPRMVRIGFGYIFSTRPSNCGLYIEPIKGLTQSVVIGWLVVSGVRSGMHRRLVSKPLLS